MTSKNSILPNGIAVDQAASLPSPRRSGSQTGSHRARCRTQEPSRKWGLHLVRRNGIFYFRRRWPEKIRRFGAPAFLSVSLRTHVLAEAVKRSADLLSAIEAGERDVLNELQNSPVCEARVQGGLNRSSQPPSEGGCDGKRQAKIRAVHESGAALTRASWRCASGRTAAVLGIDCSRTLERKRGARGGSITASRNEVVSRGRRHAPITFGTFRGETFGTVSVFRGTRGDRVDAGPGLRRAAHGAMFEPRSIDDLA